MQWINSGFFRRRAESCKFNETSSQRSTILLQESRCLVKTILATSTNVVPEAAEKRPLLLSCRQVLLGCTSLKQPCCIQKVLLLLICHAHLTFVMRASCEGNLGIHFEH